MRKIAITLLITTLLATFAFAEAKPVTGNDWIKVDKKTHLELVTNFMRDIKKEGITISRDAAFYCQKLDKLYARKPNLLNEPVWKVLKTSMIMEYDWEEKDVDQDKLAKEWLGEKLYNKNKERRAKN